MPAWAEDGTMYASEFGASTFDELNVIEAGGNYGWPEAEGIANGVFIDPIAQWATADASPSGIAVDGDRVLIANLRGRSLRAVDRSDPTRQDLLIEGQGRIRDVVVTPEGEIWAATSNLDGRGEPGEQGDLIINVSR
ncbi:hypothetical protein BSZ39_04685 [Bowdeniella nasicola]|uniref:Glucose/Sorbosone dehydrogenase domain-containing protein n=1 Tax=Bowdeniella nasicola TaxID=208480 RepID=A0A1Q5Q3W4_9ACTO|nr:PQQ-dependent sugar dehydrogenase [Bowdeniella nasicola]OKL54330.1 hypothetical protein BSZ39_04685 [Bowdeniella nasicola]